MFSEGSLSFLLFLTMTKMKGSGKISWYGVTGGVGENERSR